MSQTENQADTPTIVNPAPPAAALNGDDDHMPPEVRAALSLGATGSRTLTCFRPSASPPSTTRSSARFPLT
jgi:hypothetical protein